MSAILLRMFVASAKDLQEWFERTREAQLDDAPAKGKKKTSMGHGRQRSLHTHRMDKEDLERLDQWEALGENLNRELPRLLTRFRDDEANMSALVSLLGCCDVASNQKTLKGMLKSTVELFEQASTSKEGLGQDELLQQELCKALRGWAQIGGATKVPTCV